VDEEPEEEQVEFDDALAELESFSKSVASESVEGPVESPVESTDDNNTDDTESHRVESTDVDSDSSDDGALNIADIAISDDDDTPLSKPRERSAAEIDDGGLSLSADDEIAPIKVSATDVPEALANRTPADSNDELSLSLDDDSIVETRSTSVSADESFNELSDGIAELSIENPAGDTSSGEIDLKSLPDGDGDTEVLSSEPQEELNDSADLGGSLGSGEDAAADSMQTVLNDVGDSDDPVSEISLEAPVVELKTVTNLSDDADECEATDTSAEQQPVAAVEDSAEAAVESQSTDAPKSIAEELIESLQGSDDSLPETQAVAPPAVDSSAVIGGSDAGYDTPHEELRKSREETAVMQEKIVEDQVDEEQIYQQFELIGKKRMRQKVVAGAATAAVAVFIGAGVHYSGILTPEPVPAPILVVEAEPQRDREQESLNAAIERSATLINPETLSTEELLVTLSEGSGQDTLGDLRRYILGGSERTVDRVDKFDSEPRAGAAIPADSGSMKLLKNRVAHSGDKYFDLWSRREIDLRLYIELVDRLIGAGDIIAASELCHRTKDKLFAVMGKQSVARAYSKLGNKAEATKLLEFAARDTYSISSAAERVVAMADYAYTEHVIGRHEDSLDSYLSVSILAASLNRSEYKTIGHAAVSDYLQRADMQHESLAQLERAMAAALELPANSAARDLALRHIALTEARMGLFVEAIEHTDQIIDPFASVSAYHGIALEYEARENYAMATVVIEKAFDASSVIADKEKRKHLLSKIKLASSE